MASRSQRRAQQSRLDRAQPFPYRANNMQPRAQYDTNTGRQEGKEHSREEFPQKFVLGMDSMTSKFESSGGIEMASKNTFPGPYVPLFQYPITKGPKLLDQLVQLPPSTSRSGLRMSYDHSLFEFSSINETSNNSSFIFDSNELTMASAGQAEHDEMAISNALQKQDGSSKEIIVTIRAPMGYSVGIFREVRDIEKTFGYGGTMGDDLSDLTMEDDFGLNGDSYDLDSSTTAAQMGSPHPSNFWPKKAAKNSRSSDEWS
ncbi:hypothetical protein BGZ57DRAFT_848555 [Hyaloscypha finlandica]|nr:hypothetical protein BGZ57DRAFT_848555 [Hyaloscypha finlandica]